eukprot:PhF_6_TR6067/c0_g1_i1/m.8803/K19369/HSPB11; heat shock protein beta-11
MDVVLATSTDTRFPATAVLDTNERTFWLSTGMFPQEMILSFTGGPTSISKVKLVGYGIHRMRIERCVDAIPSKFELVVEGDVEQKDNLQKETFQINKTTLGADIRYLKIVILSGYDDFVAIHNLSVDTN